MKLTIEVEAPDHHVVPGLAAMLAPEVARLASSQLHGARFTVVSATEDGVEHPDFAVVDELGDEGDEPEVESDDEDEEPQAPGVYVEDERSPHGFFHYPWG